MQALWMVLAALFFATMAVCAKFASSDFNSAELVFYRGLISVAMMWALARVQGVRLATQVPGMHAWRSLMGVLSLGGWFYAIAHLPLATAVTLNYMSSIWVAAFLVGASLLLSKPKQTPARSQGPLVLTVIAGFVGVVLLLRPTIEQNQAFAGLVGLLSGLGAAFAYMQVSALARVGEPEIRTVYYFAVGSAVAGGLGVAVTGVSSWNWQAAAWLLPLGLFATLGQLCMTRAYTKAKTTHATLLVANLQYSGVVFGALYGLLLFHDRLPLLGWAGMLLIVLSAIAATVLRTRSVPNAPMQT